MALSRVKVWIAETLTSDDLNNEFNSILNNALTLISPLTGALDVDGQTLTLDAAAATTVVSSAAVSWNFTSGAKTGTPSTSGSVERFSAQTFTDNNTAGSGTATSHVFFSIAAPTLAATNASVTTTDAATFYIAAAPTAGTNETITNAWAIWVDAGNVRFDGVLRADSGIIDSNSNELLLWGVTASAVNEVTLTNAATGNRPRIAASGETNVGLSLRAKGTGGVVLEDGNGNEVLIMGAGTASAMNEVTVTNAATGNPARIHASGETNVSLQIEPKGSGTILMTDGADTTKKVSMVLSGIATATTRTITMPDRNITLDRLPLGSLGGCTLSNNSVDATNDIDITAGECRDSTNAVNIIVAAMTKQLDVGWAAGTNQGFRNSAAAITNTTYHVYAVSKADGTQDFYAHTSATVATVITALQAETGGSAYVYARRIGSILRESASIVGFIQSGDYFYRKVPVSEWADSSTGTSRVTKTTKVPAGIIVQALLTVTIADHSAAADHFGIINSPDAPDTAPSSSAYNMALIQVAAGAFSAMFTRPVLTNTSAQVSYRMSQSAADIFNWGTSGGWIDDRGRSS